MWHWHKFTWHLRSRVIDPRSFKVKVYSCVTLFTFYWIKWKGYKVWHWYKFTWHLRSRVIDPRSFKIKVYSCVTLFTFYWIKWKGYKVWHWHKFTWHLRSRVIDPRSWRSKSIPRSLYIMFVLNKVKRDTRWFDTSSHDTSGQGSLTQEVSRSKSIPSVTLFTFLNKVKGYKVTLVQVHMTPQVKGQTQDVSRSKFYS